MVSVIIRYGVLLALSLFEVWLYYQALFEVLIDKRYIARREKILMWICIIIVGVSMGINRKILFFSHIAFLFIIMLMIVFTKLIQRNHLLLIIGIIFVYDSLIAFLDFGFAFLGLAILGYRFNGLIYRDGLHTEKILVYACSRIIMLFIILWLRKIKIKKEILEFQNTLLVLGIVCVILVRGYQLLLARMVFRDIPVDWKSGIISLLCGIAIMGGVFFLLFKYNTIKLENNFMVLKEEMERQKYEEVIAAIEKNKELVHDMKNHLIIISEYERKGEYEKLHKYVEELRSEFVKISPNIYTGNNVIDLVLTQKRIMAGKKEIDFELQTMPLPELPFKEREICTLFGNLLDNAIEACERTDGEKKICVKIEKRKQLLFIEIINTIGERPVGVECERGFLTSKKEKDIHGYGLKSVRRIVDMYEGTMIYEIKEGEFVVRLTFFDIKEEQNEG